MIMKLDKTVVSPSHLEIYKQYTASRHMLSPCQAGEVAKRLKPRLPAPPVAGSLMKPTFVEIETDLPSGHLSHSELENHHG